MKQKEVLLTIFEKQVSELGRFYHSENTKKLNGKRHNSQDLLKKISGVRSLKRSYRVAQESKVA